LLTSCAGVAVQARDPIPQLKKYILEAGLLTEGQVKDIEKEVIEVVEEAVKFADESPKPVRAHSS
jgi:TPP-dependent pyruvate/acetoin dehydrogenase alpha subunit